MAKDWMIDILTDIRQYAQKNAMLDLAEQLDDAILVAASEIRATSVCKDMTGSHDNTDRNIHRPTTEYELV